MHLVAYRAAAGRRRRRARASAALDRVRRGRHSARSRGARRGRDDARQHSDRGVRHAVDAASWRTTVAPYVQGARRRCCWPITARSRSARICSRAYYKMETIEHFARISLVARHARARAPAVARGGRAAAGAARHATASPRRRRSVRIRRPPTIRPVRSSSRRRRPASGSCPTRASRAVRAAPFL